MALFWKVPRASPPHVYHVSLLDSEDTKYSSITHYSDGLFTICLPDQSVHSLKIWTMPLLFLGPSVYHHKPIHSKCSGSRCLNRLVG